MHDICRALQLRELEADSLLYLQGAPSTAVFLILSGGAAIFQQYKATIERTLIFEHEQQRDTRRAYLLSGDLGDQVDDVAAGEMCGEHIDSAGRHSNAAVTTEAAQVLVLPRDVYEKNLQALSPSYKPEELRERISYIQSVGYFAGWRDLHLVLVAGLLTKRTYQIHQIIAMQKKPLTHVLMVVEGEVSLCKRNLVKGAPQIEYVRCGRGTILGELEMIKHYSRLHR